MRRKKNCELEDRNITASVIRGRGSVLAWGCVSANGVWDLCFVDGIMDHKVYMNILKTHLPRSVNNMGLNGDYIFTQDNDPKHTALDTKLWLLYNTPRWMQTPPQSPDINPIENLLHILDQNIRNNQISSRKDLENALQEECRKITAQTTESLLKSMPIRMQGIIKRKGGPTKY